jgi:membrane protease YdiL (CAAX protease family)
MAGAAAGLQRPGWAAECALRRPAGGWWAWWRDPHAQWALWAAVPVWAGLALTVGPLMRAPAGPWAWVMLVGLVPAAEELVFRGLVQGQLLRLGAGRRLGPVSIANVLTSLGFGMAHLWSQPPGWALATVLPSLVFGHLRERLASVWPAVALHALYNAGFFGAAVLLRQ